MWYAWQSCTMVDSSGLPVVALSILVMVQHGWTPPPISAAELS